MSTQRCFPAPFPDLDFFNKFLLDGFRRFGHISLFAIQDWDLKIARDLDRVASLQGK